MDSPGDSAAASRWTCGSRPRREITWIGPTCRWASSATIASTADRPEPMTTTRCSGIAERQRFRFPDGLERSRTRVRPSTGASDGRSAELPIARITCDAARHAPESRTIVTPSAPERRHTAVARVGHLAPPGDLRSSGATHRRDTRRKSGKARRPPPSSMPNVPEPSDEVGRIVVDRRSWRVRARSAGAGAMASSTARPRPRSSRGSLMTI